MSLSKALINAGFAALNATAAVTLASLSLNYFNKQVCLNVSNLRGFGYSNTFSVCLPEANAIKFAQPGFNTMSDYFNQYAPYTDPLVSFGAITSGILSLYFAKEAISNLRQVFV